MVYVVAVYSFSRKLLGYLIDAENGSVVPVAPNPLDADMKCLWSEAWELSSKYKQLYPECIFKVKGYMNGSVRDVRY